MKKKSTSQPVRHNPGEGGFFNLRVLIGLVIVFAGVLLALVGFGAFSNASAQPNAGSTTSAAQQHEQGIGQRFGEMTVIPAVHSDLSPPLREQPVEWPRAREERETPVNPRIPLRYQLFPLPYIHGPAYPGPATGVPTGSRRIPMVPLEKLNTSKW
jgi:hypothetical protein